MIYTVTFNPAIDYVVHVSGLERGRTNRAEREEIQYGGKGINVSTVLRNLGFENAALGFVAGFTGEAVENGLKARGIRTDFIRLDSGLTRINVKIKSGKETEINGIGPDISPAALEELFQKLSAAEAGDIVVLAGSIPNSLPDDVYEQILRRLEGRAILTAVDATGDLLKNVLKYRPFLIKPNNHELEELFGVLLKSDEDIRACAARLQELGARNVLVSLAGDGAILLDETGVFHRIGVPKGTVKNSVGAGDSMVAGFLAGYLANRGYGYALKLGTAAGSATAFSDGLASLSEVTELLDQIDEMTAPFDRMDGADEN